MSPDVHLENEGKSIGELTMGTGVESPLSESLVILLPMVILSDEMALDEALLEAVLLAATPASIAPMIPAIAESTFAVLVLPDEKALGEILPEAVLPSATPALMAPIMPEIAGSIFAVLVLELAAWRGSSRREICGEARIRGELRKTVSQRMP